LAPRQDGMLDVALPEMVEHLIADEAAGPGVRERRFEVRRLRSTVAGVQSQALFVAHRVLHLNWPLGADVGKLCVVDADGGAAACHRVVVLDRATLVDDPECATLVPEPDGYSMDPSIRADSREDRIAGLAQICV